ncbi:MAG: alpha/beta hydrolase-fold protein [Bacteroidota bacterium]
MLAQELDYETRKMEIESAVLTENRQIELYFPKDKSEAVIAFYILDGNWNHDLVKGTIAHWVKWNLMPKALVLSVDNMGNRTRDLTPTEDDVIFPGSGGAHSFLEFISNELNPKIEKEFGNIQYKVLVGHSFGGLFTLFTLKESPSLFDGYIAISPSVWWKDRYMYSGFNSFSNTRKPFVYVTAGTDDGGNTEASQDFISWLEKKGISEKLELHFEVLEGEDHFSNVPLSLHLGIKLLFPKQKWNSDIRSAYDSGGLEELKKKTTELEQDYGIRFLFPLDALLSYALNLNQEGKLEKALELLGWVQTKQQNKYQPSYYSGYIFKNKKDNDKAIESYQKALKIGGMPDRMKTVIEREIMELTSLVKKMTDFSTEQVETSIAFNPDESLAFVSRHNGKWGERENPPSKIYQYRKTPGKWNLEGISKFSQEGTKDSDSDIFISYDGKEAFFVSTRPYSGKIDGNPDIWKSTLINEVWSEPVPIKGVNSPGYEASPVTDAQGNLYFSSVRKSGKGSGDFYMAERKGTGGYHSPRLLKGEINGASGEWNLLISPKADWMMFESSGREDGLSAYGDLYVSTKLNGVWSRPKPVTELNTTGSDLNLRYLTKSQRLLFISSKHLKNTDTNIYQMDFGEIKEYLSKSQN